MGNLNGGTAQIVKQSEIPSPLFKQSEIPSPLSGLFVSDGNCETSHTTIENTEESSNNIDLEFLKDEIKIVSSEQMP